MCGHRYVRNLQVKDSSRTIEASRSCERTFVVQLTNAVPGSHVPAMRVRPHIVVKVAYTES